jgi:guanylate kinase
MRICGNAKLGGNRYGTSKKMIEEVGAHGRIVVLDIEMEVCFLCHNLEDGLHLLFN